MGSTPIPENEASRLKTLLGYEILDTPPEDAFDDLVRLASIVCGTPIALVSLVDATRQWFKARVGLDVQYTPRDQAFCAHAIYGDDILIVPDATKDDRFASNPLVTGEPGIRFYAGMPLIAPDGQALGTICAVDRVPRKLAGEQLEALRCISRQVVSQLELRRTRAKLTSALTEKVVLLNEINHRVKNNLQIVHSIIDLQSQRVSDPVAAEVLREAKLRVRSMALIHETLYVSNNLAMVDFANFLHVLTRDLHRAYAAEKTKVVITTCADGIVLPVNIAIPCGLVVNELVTNAFKYAFVGRKHGTIRVSMAINGPTGRLSVSDDGPGIEQAGELPETPSLGTTLVRLLADQLKGSLTRTTSRGTYYDLSFPLSGPNLG